MRTDARRLGLLVVALAAGAAFAQPPEDEWGAFPAPPQPPPAPVVPPVPEPPPPPAPRVARPAAAPPPAAVPPSAFAQPQQPVEEPNTVSMMGAPTLGQWGRGQLFLLGFPLLSLRASFGLASWFDLGVGFNTFYGTMNEPVGVMRFGLFRNDSWALALTLEGGYAWFTQPASRENRGARWITGRRNINLSPAFVISYRGGNRRAARLFFEARYLMALDTEPVAQDPLGGVPPDVVVGHNGGLRGGAELPLSSKTSFVFQLGLDFHGRSEDSVAMPVCSVGLVTGI
ncbi:MAG: hypothetical protein AB1938_05830 [Myxococcota bacterium]